MVTETNRGKPRRDGGAPTSTRRRPDAVDDLASADRRARPVSRPVAAERGRVRQLPAAHRAGARRRPASSPPRDPAAQIVPVLDDLQRARWRPCRRTSSETAWVAGRAADREEAHGAARARRRDPDRRARPAVRPGAPRGGRDRPGSDGRHGRRGLPDRATASATGCCARRWSRSATEPRRVAGVSTTQIRRHGCPRSRGTKEHQTHGTNDRYRPGDDQLGDGHHRRRRADRSSPTRRASG